MALVCARAAASFGRTINRANEGKPPDVRAVDEMDALRIGARQSSANDIALRPHCLRGTQEGQVGDEIEGSVHASRR
jgi:hypothetical protein